MMKTPFEDIKSPYVDQLVDAVGRPVVYGALLYCVTGTFSDGLDGKLWMYLGQQDTRGFTFSSRSHDEGLTYHYHCTTSNSFVITHWNDDLLNAFKTGRYNFNVPFNVNGPIQDWLLTEGYKYLF